MTDTGRTTQVYRVYIKATPQAVWDAITKPEWTAKYGYPGYSEYDGLRPGGAYRAFPDEQMKAHGAPDVVVEGEVIEVDAPRKLVQTWRMNWDPEMVEEGFTRVTFLIEEEFGLSRLTVTHDVEGAPKTASALSGEMEGVGGGWSAVLSDLKTLLETGSAMVG